MIEKVGAEIMLIHHDTCLANTEETSAAAGIPDAGAPVTHIHLGESERGTPGRGAAVRDDIFAVFSAIGFGGGLAMESVITAQPEAKGEAESMEHGPLILRGRARRSRLV